jgi:ligand-binding sensor domain-containing protein
MEEIHAMPTNQAWKANRNSGALVRWSCALGLLVLLLQPVLLFAQANLLSPWKTYRQEDGLVSNNVLSILPGNGEIWFGTDAGISRFNGEWATFLPDKSTFTGDVNVMIADSATGNLWAGTHDGDVVVWDGARWLNVLKLPGAVNALIAVGSRVWIGSDVGLYVWDESATVKFDFLKNVRVQALANRGNATWVGTSEGLWIHQREQWTRISPGKELPSDDITAIWADPSGPVWVAAGGDLAWRDPSTGIWTPILTEVLQLTAPAPIESLAGDTAGVVWGGTGGNGPFRVLNRSLLVAFSGEGEIGLTTPYVQSVAVDSDGLVWFGTKSGLFRFDEKMWVKELADNVLYPGINRISALESSDDSQLWIGTSGAGIRMRPVGEGQAEEARYTINEGGLPSNAISALTRDFLDTLWAGTGAGVVRYNRATDVWESPVATAELPSERVTALLAENTHLWIGTDTGLASYGLTDDTIEIIAETKGEHIKSMTVDSLRRLWVGTVSGGLFVRETDGRTRQYHTPLQRVSGGLPEGPVVALAADPNTTGGVWVGVDLAGIFYWDNRQWHDLTDESRLPSKLLYRFYTDPIDGSLWVGSEGGVSRFDGRTWDALVVENVLPRAAIVAIGRSGNSYWFGGRDGLTQDKPEKTPPWIRFARVAGTLVSGTENAVQVAAGREIFVVYVAGDLYTPRKDLAVLYRLSKPGEIGAWMTVAGDSLILPKMETGLTNIDLQTRDQAFNYSQIVRLNLDVIAPPAMVQLPLLPPIRLDYFIAFFAIGMVALAGVAYSATEIARNRRRGREAVSRGFNPFVSGEPVRREDMFFGRYDLLRRIVDTLHNNSIMIHGERRIGKTTLLYQLATRLRDVDDTDYWLLPLYIDLEGTAEGDFFHFLMEEILNGALILPDGNLEIQPNLSGFLYYHTFESQYTDREFSRDLRDLIGLLQTYAEKRHPLKQIRIILLLDEMDVMSGYSRIAQQRLRRIFMRDFAAMLGAVVAGIQISKEWDRIESPWFNLFNEIELRPFDREQAIELLTEPIRGFYDYEPAALEYILEQSGGRPYRLQQYALEAVNHMLADKRRQILLDDVEYANEHIERVGNDPNAGIAAAIERNGRHDLGWEEENVIAESVSAATKE